MSTALAPALKSGPTTATPGGPSLHAPQPAPSPPACDVQYLRAVQARRAARGSWGRAAWPYPGVLSAALCPSSHRPIQLPGCVLWLPLAADRALPGICPAPWQAPPKRGGPGGLCATEPRWPPLTQASGSGPGRPALLCGRTPPSSHVPEATWRPSQLGPAALGARGSLFRCVRRCGHRGHALMAWRTRVRSPGTAADRPSWERASSRSHFPRLRGRC